MPKLADRMRRHFGRGALGIIERNAANGQCDAPATGRLVFPINYLIETVAPAASNSVLSFLASASDRASLILLGTPSTRSLASFKPSPVAWRTTLMTLILLSPKPPGPTPNAVAAAGAPAPPPRPAGAIITAPPAAGSMPWTSFK